MRRTAIAVALLAVSILLLNAGCYTVLRHPTGSDVVQEGQYYRTCADCHADAAYYHPYGHPYYRYGRSHYRWGSYYGSPWWYDDYWWWDDHHDHDYDYEGPEVETGSRHLWGSTGWPSGGWGFTPPGSGPARPPESPPAPPRPPRLEGAQEKPEKEKQPPKTPDLRPEQERVKNKKGSAPTTPETDDEEEEEKARPLKNPKRGS